MPVKKDVTYTIEIDAERYFQMPYFAYGGQGHPPGSLEATAEIMMTVLGNPPEMPDGIYNSWRLNNFNAIKAWIESNDFGGVIPLASVNEPTQNPISWTIKTQIRCLP
jgi:hypothetical protein